MINATNIFVIEPEDIKKVQRLLRGSNFSSEEKELIESELAVLTEDEYKDLLTLLIDRQVTELDRIRNGETLNQWQINRAVRQACNE